MNSFEYIVEKIDGDYAHLRRTDGMDGDLKLVARAILPCEITEGVRLKYELFEYSMQD
ncbi:MAG: chorismate--pyruvate lyase [Mobilitalea sp.]